jgi:hypothetical protein
MSKSVVSKIVLPGVLFVACVVSSYSQSTSQNYPTPATSNEITGEVKARDIGDSRLTTYFYTFNGAQGDMFVNLVSKNFNGSFDIFTADNLQPLTKILVYADSPESETGRIIYLRKPEKLILRIEGRTPNDDPASFTLKFAGGFVAATDTGEEAPALPEVKVSDTRTRVNSVGTVIERIPKKKPEPKPVETVAAAKEKKQEETASSTESNKTDTASEKPAEDSSAKTAEAKTEVPSQPETKVEVVVSNNLPENKPAELKKSSTSRTKTKKEPAKTQPAEVAKADTETTPKTVAPTTSPQPETNSPVSANNDKVDDEGLRTLVPPKKKKEPALPKPVVPNPLENIHLVIELKDGSKIERPMTEVVRFTVDRGILTVIMKDGSISRFNILDVSKTTIQ